jgi:hypothetical protein
MTFCFLTLGCGNKDDLVVWKAKITSPDGLWVAKAETIQNGGFGNGEIHTSVSLARENPKAVAQDVLVVECDGPIPHPYTLDNSANKGGCIGLTMAWPTSKHLHLTYEARQGTYVVFQAVKLWDVDITVESVVGGPLPKSSPYWRQLGANGRPHS